MDRRTEEHYERVEEYCGTLLESWVECVEEFRYLFDEYERSGYGDHTFGIFESMTLNPVRKREGNRKWKSGGSITTFVEVMEKLISEHTYRGNTFSPAQIAGAVGRWIDNASDRIEEVTDVILTRRGNTYTSDYVPEAPLPVLEKVVISVDKQAVLARDNDWLDAIEILPENSYEIVISRLAEIDLSRLGE